MPQVTVLAWHADIFSPNNPAPPAADWSYACIEYVSSLADPRNLATLALYAALAYVGLAARPWRVLQEWSGHCEVRWAAGLAVGACGGL